MWTDSHAHLDMEDFTNDRDTVIQRAGEKHVIHIITVGVDLKSSKAAVNLAEQYPSVYAAIGLHPHEAKGFDEDTLEKIAALSTNHKVVAWGEIGLDYYHNYCPPKDQKKAFEAQLDVAKNLHLPVIIHDRDAHEDVLTILKKFGKSERIGVIHCYSGDLDLARDLMDLGFFLSIPGTVTYKNAGPIKTVAFKMPLERMLLETDAPFLSPLPYRGKRNEPAHVAITGKEVARLRNMDPEQLATITTKNARFLFGIPDQP
ncbi:MAG: hydrolase TatD [Deltaproteobacteria bacterium]|nr:MAG: hydrolase TatD [Deltaproteobacteria bacterium]